MPDFFFFLLGPVPPLWAFFFFSCVGEVRVPRLSGTFSICFGFWRLLTSWVRNVWFSYRQSPLLVLFGTAPFPVAVMDFFFRDLVFSRLPTSSICGLFPPPRKSFRSWFSPCAKTFSPAESKSHLFSSADQFRIFPSFSSSVRPELPKRLVFTLRLSLFF